MTNTKELQSVLEIQRKLRRLVDYQQRGVCGIEVIRWPGWGKRCYEIESCMGRPGLSEHIAAKVIRLMLDGASYYQAFGEVTGKTIKPRTVRNPKDPKDPKMKGNSK